MTSRVAIPSPDDRSPPEPSSSFDGRRSVSGKVWDIRSADERAALAITQAQGVSDVLARAMAARGIGVDGAAAFLAPTLKELLPDPSRFQDMDKAAKRIADAVTNGERIAIFADYDVDGATSSAIVARFLRTCGAAPLVYIPDRLKEGYGPSDAAMNKLAAEGIDVVVMLDCGTTAFASLETARSAGLAVIVVDHHEAEPELPPVAALVNPNRLDEDRVYGHLCSAGLAFLLVVAVNRELRERGYWTDAKSEPVLTRWLDLVALGTVCDVVRLTDLNRAFVVQGLKVMANRGNTGLRVLADVSGLNETPGSYHLGFVLGPRINAGGRIGDSGLGARLLRTEDEGEAVGIATKLDVLNAERKEIEHAVFEDAVQQVETEREPAGITIVAGENWHPGVVGIVASRLVERYNRPACVISLSDGEGTGSGRSVPGIDLGSMIIAARQSGLLMKGGGHAMAAGFSLAVGRIQEFRDFMAARIAAADADLAAAGTVRLDGMLAVRGATIELAEELARLGPFGPGNAEPRFAFTNLRISFSDVVGKDHVRASLTGAAGAGTLDAICFRAAGTPLGDLLLGARDEPVHVAGRLKVDTWRGVSRVKLHIEDAMPAWG